MKTSGNFSTASRPGTPNFDAPARRRFALSRRSVAIDPRITAARRDIADVRLADRIFAPHYAAPLPKTCVENAQLRRGTSANAEILSEVLSGERFDVLEFNAGLAWGMGCTDGVVGFVDAEALGPYCPAKHVPAGGNHVAIAEGLIGAPRQLGGRSRIGLNCSGLIFLALHEAGIASPRFCDLQRGLGEDANGELERGDLVFFADHAAIMTGATTVVHVASGGVAVDDLAALTRGFGPVVARRRLAA